MKTPTSLDISHIPTEHTCLSWVKMLFEATKPDSIIISEDQAKNVFCMADGVIWDLYRGIEIKIAIHPSTYSLLIKKGQLMTDKPLQVDKE